MRDTKREKPSSIVNQHSNTQSKSNGSTSTSSNTSYSGSIQFASKIGNLAATKLMTKSDPKSYNKKPLSMPSNLKSNMENSFNADFVNVKLNETEHADSIGAKAYASGNTVNFAKGEFQPNTTSGQELIGHELSHVVSQQKGEVDAPQGNGLNAVISPELEHRADVEGKMAASGKEISGLSDNKTVIQSGSQGPIQGRWGFSNPFKRKSKKVAPEIKPTTTKVSKETVLEETNDDIQKLENNNTEETNENIQKLENTNTEQSNENTKKVQNNNTEKTNENTQKLENTNTEQTNENIQKLENINTEQSNENTKKVQNTNTKETNNNTQKLENTNTEQTNDNTQKVQNNNTEQTNDNTQKVQNNNTEQTNDNTQKVQNTNTEQTNDNTQKEQNNNTEQTNDNTQEVQNNNIEQTKKVTKPNTIYKGSKPGNGFVKYVKAIKAAPKGRLDDNQSLLEKSIDDTEKKVMKPTNIVGGLTSRVSSVFQENANKKANAPKGTNVKSTDSQVTAGIGSGLKVAGMLKEIVGMFKKVKGAFKIHEKKKSGAYGKKRIAKESLDTSYGLAASLTTFLGSINNMYKVMDGINSKGFLPKEYTPALGLVLSGINIIRTAVTMVQNRKHVSKSKDMRSKLEKKDTIKNEEGTSYSSMKEKSGFISRNLTFNKDKRKQAKERYKARKAYEKKLKGHTKTDRDSLNEDEKQFSLLLDLEEIEDKRFKRGLLNLGLDLANVTSGIMTLSGVGAVGGLIMSSVTTGVRLGFFGARKLKQKYRDKGGRFANKNKTTEAKEASYKRNATALIASAKRLPDYSINDEQINKDYYGVENMYKMTGAITRNLLHTALTKNQASVEKDLIDAMKER